MGIAALNPSYDAEPPFRHCEERAAQPPRRRNPDSGVAALDRFGACGASQ